MKPQERELCDKLKAQISKESRELADLAERARKLDTDRSAHRKELSNLLGVKDIYLYKNHEVKIYINRGDEVLIRLIDHVGVERGGGFATIVHPEDLELVPEKVAEGIG